MFLDRVSKKKHTSIVLFKLCSAKWLRAIENPSMGEECAYHLLKMYPPYANDGSFKRSMTTRFEYINDTEVPDVYKPVEEIAEAIGNFEIGSKGFRTRLYSHPGVYCKHYISMGVYGYLSPQELYAICKEATLSPIFIVGKQKY